MQGKWYKAAIIVALGMGIVVALGTRRPAAEEPVGQAPQEGPAPTANAPAATDAPANKGLPRLLDLGAGKCIPCKMMAPILDELKREQAGKINVEFIDVWKDPSAGQQYGINVIPTQIFYDAQGQELFRHEGFFAKDKILAVFRKHGIALAAGKAKATAGDSSKGS